MTDQALAKKRAKKAREARKARTKSTIAVAFVSAIPTCDSGNSMSHCRICGDRIGFTTDNGRVVPLDWGTLNSHRHGEG